MIRGVQKIEPERLILKGPLVSMCAIIGEIGDLTLNDSDLFRLTFDSNDEILKIKATDRIGLGKDKHSGGNRDIYLGIRWRYHTYPNDYLSSKTSKIERPLQ